MSVKTHKFSTGTFRITRESIDGYCDAPEFNHPTYREIRVMPGLSEMDELETWIHESTHAEHPRMSERRVHASAHNIARGMWGKGYRKSGVVARGGLAQIRGDFYQMSLTEYPDMPGRVRESAHNIARLLWRLGYRKVKK